MKSFFSFWWKKPLSESPAESADSVGYELKDKDLTDLHKAAANGDLSKLCKYIVRKRKNVNVQDRKQRTPLHIACALGHVEAVDFLVTLKADLNRPDSDQRSPLMKAVQGKHQSCVDLLLQSQAKTDLKDVCGNTALHLAAKSSTTSITKMLLRHLSDINAPNNQGMTPLAMAVTHDHTDMAEFLLKEGADVNSSDNDGRSPLMMAAARGLSHMTQLLLRNGADPSQTDRSGRSAYDHGNGHLSCSGLITEHRSEPQEDDEDRATLQNKSHQITTRAKCEERDSRRTDSDPEEGPSSTQPRAHTESAEALPLKTSPQTDSESETE